MNTNNETHSPAPWEIGYRLRMDGVREPDRIMSADGNNVCEGLAWSENAKHNALLLTAAPDMLEALKDFVNACDNVTPIVFLAHINRACEKARAAIAKATIIEEP